MKSSKPVLLLAVLLLATAPLTLAQGTYTQIDYPGSILTQAMGINASGDIVGSYSTATGASEGFLLSNGLFTTISYPGAAFTNADGINDLGQIVGSGIRQPNPTEPSVGFIYDLQSQTFTEVSTHDPSVVVAPLAINNAGIIVGVVLPTQSTPYTGFVASSGKFQFFQVPGASGTWVGGIGANDKIVGYCAKMRGDAKLQSFFFLSHKFKFLFVPDTPDALVTGISSSGSAIVGYYPQNRSVDRFFGFVYQIGAVTSIQFPDAFSTWATGVNDSGQVVGYFQDASLNFHGFTWTPPAAAEKK